MRGIFPLHAKRALYQKIPQAVGVEEQKHSNAAIHGGVFRTDKTQSEKSIYPQK